MNINLIIQFVKKNNLLVASETVILGLSGGPDSIFLLHILKEFQKDLNFTLLAAHLDHEWRKDSDDDVTFCAHVCTTLDIPFISAKASELSIPIKKTGSKEALARSWRRHFLETVRKENNGTKIALAHHEQDQQETFFIRLIRGASLTGLTAMKPKAGYFIRPLLQTSKSDILAYLHGHNIPYLVDSTNSSEDYLRNRIRLHVLPALQKADTRFDSNFLSTLKSLQKTEQFLHNLTVKSYKELLTEKGQSSLDLRALLNLDNFLQKRVLLHWLIEHKVPFNPSQNFLLEIQKFFNNIKSNSHRIHTSWVIGKQQNRVFIKKID